MNQFTEEFVKKAFFVFLVGVFFASSVKSQTLVINEFSNGPSGSQEYIELIVIDTSTSTSCNPCIDIRGWIIDDNNGYHGSSGIASGCNRFSNDAFWSCIPYGTIITLYNGSDPNVDLPTNDFDLNDGNCSLVMPIENSTYFETNPSTPGAVACSYPLTGWVAGGVWTRIGMRNGGDCIRVVDLTGCEVFSLSYGDITANSTVYFPGSGTDDVFYFSGNDPYNQADWLQGCAGDVGACVGNDQTPGAFNSNLNDDYISQFRVNNCQLIEPLVIYSFSEGITCINEGLAYAEVSSGGVGPYFYDWYDEDFQAIGQTDNTASGLSMGLYYCIVTPTYGCADTVQLTVGLSATAPYVTASNQVNTCEGSCSGSITVQGQSGTISYWYYYGDPYAAGNTPINPVPTASPIQLDNLCSGTYTVTLLDQNGCTGENITFTINTELNSESTTDLTICENDLPFIWNGLTFNNSDSQTATLPALNGCDSLATLNLTVISEFTGLETHTGCIGDGYSVEVNGNTYDEINPSGTEILLSSAGCDSTITVNLTFNNNTTGNETYTGCSGDGYSVVVNGNTYDEANPFGTESMSNIFGCDSIVTIDLTFNTSSNGSETYIGCSGDGYSINVNGVSYDESNPSGTETLSNTNGCDSSVTIDLIFNNLSNGSETYAGCSGDGYAVVVNGTTYDEANPAGTETLNNTFGCDSTVTIDLTFNTVNNGVETYTGCSGDGYAIVVNGVTYDESSPSGTETMSNIYGCDSSVTIDLTFNTSSIGSETYIGCSGDGYSINVNGVSYDESNPSGTETLSNTNGCDSTVTIDLIFNTLSNGSEIYTGCSGDGYAVVVNGTTYDEANPLGTETLSNAFGCDSTVSIDLTFNTVNNGVETYTGCSGDGYAVLVNGVTYDESNPSGTETMSNIFGCDSTISIDLTFNSPSTGSEVHIGCNGDGYAVTVNGIIYNEANPTGIETLSNINGCDSVVSINLTFNSSITGNESYTGCTGDGYSVIVNGTAYDEANPSGTETLTAVAGCDSIVTVDLVFNAISSSTDVQSACDSYTWIDGNTYTASNNSTTWVLPSVSGCDSTVTLDLTITNSNTGTDTKSACDTYTWIDGNTYTANNNSATWILTNIDGCDSLVTLDLIINTSPTLIDFTNGGIYCEGEVVNGLVAEVSGIPDFTLDYTLNGNPLSISSSSSSIDVGSSAGEYTLNVLTDNYCTTTLNQSQTIVIHPIPDIPSLGEDAVYCSNAVPEAIQVSGSSGTYSWYFDASLTEILTTEDEYTPDVILGGSTYYVTATENGCEGLPAEISITFEDCQIIIPTAFTPDNDQVNDFWELGNIDDIYPKNVVSVYNRWGNKIYESDQGAYDQRPWKGDYNGNFLPVGSYYYILEFNDNVTGEKTGIVSILK